MKHETMLRAEQDSAVSTIDATVWANKFSIISPWFERLLSQIKKDCKSEHLSVDPHFVRVHFAGKPVPKISLEDMRIVYLHQIFSGHDRLAEFIANRWLFRNMDLYRFFESRLESQVPDFETVKALPKDIIEPILADAILQFGSEMVFCFVVLNDVALPKELFDGLQKTALEELSKDSANHGFANREDKEIQTLRAEIVTLKERHEKKCTEMQRKQKQQVDRLEKEIVLLREEVKKYKSKV